MRLLVAALALGLAACAVDPAPTPDAGSDTNVCRREQKWDPDCAPDLAYECSEDAPPENDCYRIGVGSDAFNVAWCCPAN